MTSSVPLTSARSRPTGPVASVLLAVIGGYRRFISPFLGPRCRFYPTCSEYAVRAIKLHGAGRGLLLAVGRIGRCHPWNPGGYDPVPPRAESTKTSSTEARSLAGAGATTGVTRC